MVRLLLLSLAAAATALLDTEGAAAATQAKNSATRIPAQLAQLQLGKEKTEILPITTDGSTPAEDYVNKVCGAMKAGKVPDGVTADSGEGKLVGTYAYAVQDGDEGDCNAAVKYWKEALKNFSGIPPVYTSNQTPYDNPQNISFISLFNPKSNPKVDCAYFVCPADVAESSSQRTSSDPSTETDKKGLKAVLCITTPSALEATKAPYTQDQWNNITAAVNSGSAAAPALLLLIAAALGVSFF
ncbi:SAG family member [Eimeria praecox]|uniref:SAG family member n=1 Tax=Eimeria praecox TaxID=51316 RepID=U6G8A5_9EIME|nr:SAG family member [Eimeria praecox]